MAFLLLYAAFWVMLILIAFLATTFSPEGRALKPYWRAKARIRKQYQRMSHAAGERLDEADASGHEGAWIWHGLVWGPDVGLEGFLLRESPLLHYRVKLCHEAFEAENGYAELPESLGLVEEGPVYALAREDAVEERRVVASLRDPRVDVLRFSDDAVERSTRILLTGDGDWGYDW